MYCILSNELENETLDANLSGSLNIDVGGELSFDLGETIKKDLPELIYTTNKNSIAGRMTDHITLAETTGLVMSNHCLKILNNEHNLNIQSYKFNIVDIKTNKTDNSYSLVNILDLIDCIDTKNSELKYFESGNIKRITKLVIDENLIPSNQKIFRLSKRKNLIFVHESIKDTIKQNGLTGFVFYKSEEYQ